MDVAESVAGETRTVGAVIEALKVLKHYDVPPPA
jgi:hypothetical protein